MKRNNIQAIVDVLRRVTHIVKVVPFIGAFFYLIAIVGYIFLPESAIRVLDLVFYCSPLNVVVMLMLSKRLMLCNWHRFQCFLPIIALMPSLVNRFIYPLSSVALDVNIALMVIIFLLSIINAYHVFIKPSVRK